jgi:hypothetical protein
LDTRACTVRNFRAILQRHRQLRLCSRRRFLLAKARHSEQQENRHGRLVWISLSCKLIHRLWVEGMRKTNRTRIGSPLKTNNGGLRRLERGLHRACRHNPIQLRQLIRRCRPQFLLRHKMSVSRKSRTGNKASPIPPTMINEGDGTSLLPLPLRRLSRSLIGWSGSRELGSTGRGRVWG